MIRSRTTTWVVALTVAWIARGASSQTVLPARVSLRVENLRSTCVAPHQRPGIEAHSLGHGRVHIEVRDVLDRATDAPTYSGLVHDGMIEILPVGADASAVGSTCRKRVEFDLVAVPRGSYLVVATLDYLPTASTEPRRATTHLTVTAR